MAGPNQECNPGVLIYRAWDSTDGIYPLIIAPENIIKTRKIGTVENDDDITYLKSVWKEKFDSKYEFFPLVDTTLN